MAPRGGEAESSNTNNKRRGAGSKAGRRGKVGRLARPNQPGRLATRGGVSKGAGMHSIKDGEATLGSIQVLARSALDVRNT